MRMNISKNCKLVKVLDSQTTGTGTLTTDPIDTEGFDCVAIFGKIATVDPGNYAKARQGADSAMGDAADLLGTKIVPGTNGNSFLIDIHRPTKRYVDVQIVRAGATTVTGDVYALLCCPRKAPVTQGSTIDVELHISPAEGTA